MNTFIGLSPEDARTLWFFGFNLVVGGLLGLFIAALYRRYGTAASDREEFARMFPLFTMVTILVIAVVQASLALSLGLIGALTIVRFRGPIKSPEEIVYLLFCVSMGLALGAGQPVLAVVAAAIVAMLVILRPIANRPAYEKPFLLRVAGDAKHFFPAAGFSGLERLSKIKPVTFQRLDQDGDRVELRAIMTIEAAEEPAKVLEELRGELPQFEVYSVDLEEVQAGRSQATSERAGKAGKVKVRSPGKLELVEEPREVSGVDLFRREVKFALPNGDAAKVRSILDVNCQRIVHSGPSSMVNTIYYDDIRLSGCQENLDGVPRRAKVRLRWYDDDDRGGRVFFEIKRRVDSMVHKERLELRAHQPLGDLTYREILEELQRVLPDSAAEMLLARPEAILLTEYRREYFRAPGSRARITLDEDIVSYSQRGLRRPRKGFGTKGSELVILEAKIPKAAGEELRALLYPLEPYVTKSSKYVQGCLRLGLLDGSSVTE